MKDYILNGLVYIDANSLEKFGYSDGDETENYIFDAVNSANDLSAGSEELIAYIKDWPSLYHLHPKRFNLLRPLEGALKGKNILEIGAGCGAITRYLGETAKSVTALEGSLRRAQITAARCRDLSTVKVICDNFLHYTPAEKFDVITLIGVLEYSNLYMKGDDPVGLMLDRIRSLLAPAGILVIAIENKLGLKYWAGAPEDHTGVAYHGIENRYSSSSVVTFGKKELQGLLENNGFADTAFLYPFPDYKLADSIVTDLGLQTKEFSVPMLLLEDIEYVQSQYYSNHFSTTLAAAELDKNGLLAEFSNSFLIVATLASLRDVVAPDLLAARYNSQRKKEFQKVNTFRQINGQIVVEKDRLYAQAAVQETPVRNVIVKEPYFRGRLLLFDAIKIVSQKEWALDSLARWGHQYFTILSQLAIEEDGQLMIDGRYLDLTPFNIILDDQDEPHIFDQEWIYPGHLPLGYIFFRGINYSLGAISFFNIPAEGVPEDILELTCALYQRSLPLTEGIVADYRALESRIVSGIGVGDYVPFLGAPLKIRMESLMERQVLQLEREKVQVEREKAQVETSMRARIEELQTHLAHANHEKFLKEAELEAVRHMAARTQPSFPEMDRIKGEVDRLSSQINHIRSRQTSSNGVPLTTEEKGSVAALNAQITDLQNSLLWYKRTYEDRSFLGVIRQKIATKFTK